jgi:aminopeptidase N
VRDSYDAAKQIYTLTFEQSCPGSEPLHIPIALALLPANDTVVDDSLEQHEGVLELTARSQSFSFAHVESKPVPSLLRGFSAPVKLDYAYSDEQLLSLMQNDSDGFNRWDAGQLLATRTLQKLVADFRNGSALQLDDTLPNAYARLLADTELDPAMVALMLQLPSEAYISEEADIIYVDAIHAARDFAKRHIAASLQALLLEVYRANICQQPYRAEPEQMARRSLKNQCLAYLAATETDAAVELCRDQYANADNMTDTLAALGSLLQIDTDGAHQLSQRLLDDFYQRFSQESLAVNQWFQIQATATRPGALQRVQQLMQHPAYEASNPNKVRSLVAAFCNANPVNFHQRDGSGYHFLVDQVSTIDGDNPQLASRLLVPLTRWKKYPPTNAEAMRGALEALSKGQTLSRDVYEIVSKSLA